MSKLGKKPISIPKDTKVKVDGGKLTLNGKNYVGDYHQHSNGTYMTGSTHSENSEILLISKSTYNDVRKMHKISQKLKHTASNYNKTSGRIVR